MTTHHEEFDTLGEYLNYLEKTQSPWKEQNQEAKNDKPRPWNGDVTYQGAFELAHKGWEQGRAVFFRG